MPELKLNPLYSLNDSVTDTNIFNGVRFDDISRELIKKSTIGVRHAVVGWVPIGSNLKKNKVLETRSRPGLPADATPDDILYAKNIYGEGRFVQAEHQGTGVVHRQTINQVEDEERQLQSSLYAHIALSFNIEQYGDEKILSWLNRSTQNEWLFEADELALACLTFDPNETNIDGPIPYTLAYDLKRSVPETILNQYVSAAQKDLKIASKLGDCHSIRFERFWNTVVAMKENEKQEQIKQLLMTNLYIASALPPKTNEGSFTKGYEEDIKRIYEVARKYGIRIDPDFVPEKFKEKTEHASPLIMAAKSGNWDVVTLLIEKGADINKKDRNGNSALWWAVHNNHNKIAELLINKGAIVNCKNNEGIAPIHLLAEKGNKDMLELLVGKGAAIFSQTNDWYTPIWIAAVKGHDAVLEFLSLGQDPYVLNSPNENGMTPAAAAAVGGYLGALKILSANKADLSIEDDDKRTPAWWAASEGHVEVLAFLAKEGVDLNQPDSTGKTPRAIAEENGRDEVVAFFVKLASKSEQAPVENTSFSTSSTAGMIGMLGIPEKSKQSKAEHRDSPAEPSRKSSATATGIESEKPKPIEESLDELDSRHFTDNKP